MRVEVLPLDHQHILNYATKIVSQDNVSNTKVRAEFPIIDTFVSESKTKNNKFNSVSFIYKRELNNTEDIYLVGNFDNLFTHYQLTQVLFNDTVTQFFAITLKIPYNHKFQYKFKVGNTFINDPLNPATEKADNGKRWSMFFSDYYSRSITLESWEEVILKRFIGFILPIQTPEFKKFIQRHQAQFNDLTRSLVSQATFDIGITSYIDKLITRVERHHIPNYKLCLIGMKSTLTTINQFQEPEDMDIYYYKTLYEIMQSNNFNQWDKSIYDNPAYFLKVLRRHIITGAFSHPRHGGNINALGWEYISDLLQNDKNNLFDWQRSLEHPLGKNLDYIG